MFSSNSIFGNNNNSGSGSGSGSLFGGNNSSSNNNSLFGNNNNGGNNSSPFGGNNNNGNNSMLGNNGGSNNFNTNNDFIINDHPKQAGIQDLSFCPSQDFLCAGCWDGNAYVYQIAQNGNNNAIAGAKAVWKAPVQAPVLHTSWNAQGSHVFLASADNSVKMFKLGDTNGQVVARHGAPINYCQFVNPNSNMNLLLTGGLDGKICYWDLRNPSPVAGFQCDGKIYGMDYKKNMVACVLSNEKVHIFNITDPNRPFKTEQSPLKNQQHRTIACFPDQDGYAVGSIEGRVGIQYLNGNKSNKKSFVFKCHRVKSSNGNMTEVYPINQIKFNQFGSFSTIGSDGCYFFWDKNTKSKLKKGNSCGQTISCCDWSRRGTMFAYAVSYDWFKGPYGNKDGPNHILVHKVEESDIKKSSF